MAHEGYAAFWKGAVPTAMGMVAENAMAFGVNEALKRTFPDDAKEDPTKRPDLIRPFLMVCSIDSTPHVIPLPTSHTYIMLRFAMHPN